MPVLSGSLRLEPLWAPLPNQAAQYAEQAPWWPQSSVPSCQLWSRTGLSSPQSADARCQIDGRDSYAEAEKVTIGSIRYCQRISFITTSLKSCQRGNIFLPHKTTNVTRRIFDLFSRWLNTAPPTFILLKIKILFFYMNQIKLVLRNSKKKKKKKKIKVSLWISGCRFSRLGQNCSLKWTWQLRCQWPKVMPSVTG